jgi:uncharacterized protein (TIGR03435 family)
MVKRVTASAIWLACSAVMFAQPPVASELKPVFEVASVKRSKTTGKPSLRVFPGGRTVATNATLKFLIGLAYNVRDYQITGGAKWIESTEYDIDAKPAVAFQPSYSTREYAMRMQQALLEERFKLSIRRTSKELPLYVLTPGKDGPKLKAREKPEKPSDMKMSGGKGLMIGQGLPIAIIVESLSEVLERPVSDATGLTGYYDFRLDWMPDEVDATTPRSDSTGPSLFTAVQEQLGLKLEPRKGPVDVLAIETAMQPSEN